MPTVQSWRFFTIAHGDLSSEGLRESFGDAFLLLALEPLEPEPIQGLRTLVTSRSGAHSVDDLSQSTIYFLSPPGTPLSEGAMVGRSAGSRVTLEDGRLSSRHARFFRDASGGCCIEDLGSTNGTRVDHELLSPGHPRPLEGNEVIVFGGVLGGTFHTADSLELFLKFVAR